MKKVLIICCFSILIHSLFALPFTHYTSDYLRLRSDANLDAKIITVLDPDLGVELLEKGKADTIDGITASWVKVRSANGYEGWCFSGYLSQIETNVAEKLALEIADVKAGSYPPKNYENLSTRNISSISDFKGKEGYYIQQRTRGFQDSGRAPEILELKLSNQKVFVREIDIKEKKTKILKETEFSFDGKTWAHNKSYIKLDEKKQLNIFYLENKPDKTWLGTAEFENPYTRVADINSKQLINQTSDVLKNYAGQYEYDSFKIVYSKNKEPEMKNIQNAKINISLDESKKCLSVACHDLIDIVEPGNKIGNWTLDFVETSSLEPFYWTYGEGTGYCEEKFWFYKGGIAISYEYKGALFDENHNYAGEESLKYAVFLKKVK